MATLVLFGATGYAGSRILEEAIARGHEVVAVARDVSDLPAREKVRPVAGSIFDADFVRRVTEGADVIVISVAPRLTEQHALTDAFPALVEAAQRTGARIGVVGGASSLFTADGGTQVYSLIKDNLPPAALPHVRNLMEMLDALKATPDEIDWFYLSPPLTFGAHAPAARRGTYRLGGDVLVTDENGDSAIGGEDYAIAFVDEIDNPTHHRQRFTVGY